MVKAIIIGCAGRMGGRIIHLITETDGIEVKGAVERKDHALLGKDAGEQVGVGTLGVEICDDLAKVVECGDVIIDFSHHDAVVDHLRIARDHNKAVVIGTTGLKANEIEDLKDFSTRLKCVFAPNMSVGVNVMFKVLEFVTGILGDDYNIEILEAHHNQKKDAPSGTAVKMAQIIAEKLDRNLESVGVYGRKGMIGARTKEEIGIQVIRAGDIAGEHTVMFGGIGERLEFTHRAHSRDNFARGAIRAAMWIVHQQNGLYDMQDVLGLRQ